jgi:hypothetical protein
MEPLISHDQPLSLNLLPPRAFIQPLPNSFSLPPAPLSTNMFWNRQELFVSLFTVEGRPLTGHLVTKNTNYAVGSQTPGS